MYGIKELKSISVDVYVDKKTDAPYVGVSMMFDFDDLDSGLVAYNFKDVKVGFREKTTIYDAWLSYTLKQRISTLIELHQNKKITCFTLEIITDGESNIKSFKVLADE